MVNFVLVVVVIWEWQALSGIIGCKVSVGGLESLLLKCGV